MDFKINYNGLSSLNYIHNYLFRPHEKCLTDIEF